MMRKSDPEPHALYEDLQKAYRFVVVKIAVQSRPPSLPQQRNGGLWVRQKAGVISSTMPNLKIGGSAYGTPKSNQGLGKGANNTGGFGNANGKLDHVLVDRDLDEASRPENLRPDIAHMGPVRVRHAVCRISGGDHCAHPPRAEFFSAKHLKKMAIFNDLAHQIPMGGGGDGHIVTGGHVDPYRPAGARQP